MEQKSEIEDKIILELDSGEKHIRQISSLIGINHMSVKRILDKLIEENCVDFEIVGKNKVFSLKKNIETRRKIISAELYKQKELIEKYPIFRKIFGEIISNEKIKLAILFGSYVKNIPTKTSDIDIYIEGKSNNLKKDIEKINSLIDVKQGIFDSENLLIKEIIKNHVVIKGLERYYEKTH